MDNLSKNRKSTLLDSIFFPGDIRKIMQSKGSMTELCEPGIFTETESVQLEKAFHLLDNGMIPKGSYFVCGSAEVRTDSGETIPVRSYNYIEDPEGKVVFPNAGVDSLSDNFNQWYVTLVDDLLIEGVKEISTTVKPLADRPRQEVAKTMEYRFLECLFKDYLKEHKGYIEIREISSFHKPRLFFYKSISDLWNTLYAINFAWKFYRTNTYFGVCPRERKRGKDKDIKYISTLWVDIDVGKIGHKRASEYATKSIALEEINRIRPVPSIVVDSGHGFHVYWLLDKVYSLDSQENRHRMRLILDGLIRATSADNAGDFPRILRMPNTANLKAMSDCAKCEIIRINEDCRYSIDDFREYEAEAVKESQRERKADFQGHEGPSVDIGILPSNIEAMIEYGDISSKYPSRSERDQAVVFSLVRHGFTDDEIKSVFMNPGNAVSDKYLEKGRGGDNYLSLAIRKAKSYKPELLWFPMPKHLDTVLKQLLRPRNKELLIFNEEFRAEDFNRNVVYSKEHKQEDAELDVQYHIKGSDIERLKNKYKLLPGAKLITRYMNEAYLTTFALAVEQKSVFVTATMRQKYGLLGKHKRVSGKEEKGRLLSEELLGATSYIVSIKRNGEALRERREKLYSSVEVILGRGRTPTTLKIRLNEEYYGDFPFDLQMIGKWTTVGKSFLKVGLPMGVNRLSDKHAEYKRKARIYLGGFFMGQSAKVDLSIKRFFDEIGVSDRIRQRKKDSRNLYEELLPTFKDLGLRSNTVRIHGKDQDDVRNWVLRIILPPSGKTDMRGRK